MQSSSKSRFIRKNKRAERACTSRRRPEVIHYCDCLKPLHDYSFQIESRGAASKAVAQADFVCNAVLNEPPGDCYMIGLCHSSGSTQRLGPLLMTGDGCRKSETEFFLIYVLVVVAHDTCVQVLHLRASVTHERMTNKMKGRSGATRCSGDDFGAGSANC